MVMKNDSAEIWYQIISELYICWIIPSKVVDEILYAIASAHK